MSAGGAVRSQSFFFTALPRDGPAPRRLSGDAGAARRILRFSTRAVRRRQKKRRRTCTETGMLS